MFERCLYFNINSLTRAINRIWDEAFAEFELSPSHAYLLRLVLATPGLTPKQISQELKIEKSTVTRFLDALSNKGLVMRRKSPSSDAREQSIHPTKKAEAIALKLETRGNALYQKMTDSIGKEQLMSLVTQLRQTESQLK